MYSTESGSTLSTVSPFAFTHVWSIGTHEPDSGGKGAH